MFSQSISEPIPHVGLKNQGCTCYMNSVLQSLFHTPAFKKLVFQMPTTGEEDVSSSIVLNLQRLFYLLQLAKSAPSTKALTKSFGWNDYDTFVQHDVQEFCRVLLDNFETKTKGTPLEGRVASLFRGKLKNFIRCLNVDESHEKEEFFYDINLVVKGCSSLEESFAKSLEKEFLTGDNQYQSDKYGKQDIEKGIEYSELPNVLHIHLRRFEYDFQTRMMQKINDRFTFPSEFDFENFLATDSKKDESYVYDLVGVLVHSGSAFSGHYYSFLRTSSDPQWYKFDDQTVSRATEADAIESNFGQSVSSGTNVKYGYSSYCGYSTSYGFSAYMLVYFRRSKFDTIFTEISEDEIPPHLVKFASSSKSASGSKHKIQFYTEKSFKLNLRELEFSCLHDEDKLEVDIDELNHDSLHKAACDAFNKPSGSFFLFSISNNLPYSLMQKNVYQSYFKTQQLFFLPKSEDDPEENGSNNILFLFFFFSQQLSNPLQFIGSSFLDKSSNAEVLSKKFCKLIGFNEEIEFKISEFDYYKNLTDFSPKFYYYGPVKLVFEFLHDIPFPQTDFEFDELKKKNKAKTETNVPEDDLPKFSLVEETKTLKLSEYLKPNKSDETFVTFFKYEDIESPFCHLLVREKTKFQKIFDFILPHLNIEYDSEKQKLVLLKREQNNGFSNVNLDSELLIFTNSKYDFCVVPFAKNSSYYYSSPNAFIIVIFNSDFIKVSEKLFISASNNFSSLELRKFLGLDDISIYRFFKVYGGYIQSELTKADYVWNSARIFAFPKFEEDEDSIYVYYCLLNNSSGNTFQTTGDPGVIQIKKTATVLDVKNKFVTQLRLDNSLFKKIDIAVSKVSNSYISNLKKMADSVIVFDHFSDSSIFPDEHLCLILPSQSSSSFSSWKSTEQSVKIYN